MRLYRLGQGKELLYHITEVYVSEPTSETNVIKIWKPIDFEENKTYLIAIQALYGIKQKRDIIQKSQKGFKHEDETNGKHFLEGNQGQKIH